MDRDDRVLSLLLNAEMDSVGFNKESVRRRVEMFNKRSKAKAAASRKLLGYNKEKVIVGSRRDGIGTETSDTDVLLINHNVYCSTDAKELDKIDNKVCFLLENEDAPPGYAFLSLYSGSNGEHFKEIESSTEFKNGKIYLSNDKYMSILKEEQFTSRKGWFGRTVQIGTRKGPSIPKTVDAVGFEADLVGAFPVSFKGIISDWQAKERLHDWPNKETVQKVAKLPMYVVAVGEQGSSNENLLWRLSFNEHEMILVYSMNDSQTKVLVLMRLLAKNLLTPICPAITSYVIKNVVLHVAEQHPLEEFNKEKLFHRLRDCLKYLRCCIKDRLLPNYMNSGRNLFHGKIYDGTMAPNAIHAIGNILENGRDIFLFYLINKMKPDNIRSRYPSILRIRDSLMQGYIEDTFAQKKVKAMTLEQLIKFHIHADSCTSEVKLILLEIYYVYIPFYLKYGLRSLKSDLSKVRAQKEKRKILLHLQDEPTVSEDCDDTDQLDIIDDEPATHDFEQEETEDLEQSEHLEGRTMETNTFAGTIWTYLIAVLYTLFWNCIGAMKSLLLNLIEVLHLLCVIFTCVYVRNYVLEDTHWLVDIVGAVWITATGISVIQKKIASIFNLFYIALLMMFLWIRMIYADHYPISFQEMYVNLDLQNLLNNFRTADIDMDDREYYLRERTLYA